MIKVFKGLFAAVCLFGTTTVFAQNYSNSDIGNLMTNPDVGCANGFGQYGYMDCGGGSGGGSVTPAAPRTVVINKYGAVAWNLQTGGFDSSYNEISAANAKKVAMSKCGPDCKIVSAYQNQCTAIGFGRVKNRKAGYQANGYDVSRKIAEFKAMQLCTSKADNCKIILSECSIYNS